MNSDDERRVDYPGWRVAVAGSVGVFFASLVVVTFPVLLTPLSREFGGSRESVSGAFAIAAAVAALCAGPLGILLDRVGARRVAIPALVLYGCAFASLAWLSPRPWHLYATFAVLGATGMGTSPVAYGRAISTWFAARRGMALAIVITGGALGGMLHPLVAQALIRQFGWRGACLGLGLAALAFGVPTVARLVRERPTRRSDPAPSTGSSLGAGLRSLAFWVLAGCILCGTMVQNSVVVHLHALLTDRGATPGAAAGALSVMAAAAVAGRLVTGLLIDRMFAARVGMMLLVLAALGAGLLSGARSYPLSVLAAALVGFGTGGESDIVPYLLTRYFGLRSFSALYGFTWMAGALGGSLGPILMGRAFDTSGSYGPTLIRLAIVALAAAGIMLALPRYGADRPALSPIR